MNTNDRRPEGWTSADAAGLAILPGLVRYDEVFGPDEIGHAFRVTVRATNGYVYPASHTAGGSCPAAALPMGARLRLKAGKDISGFHPGVQKIFRAMKKYGLIVADNGSDMYISGTYDTRWPDVFDAGFHSAFKSLDASKFEVVQRGWRARPQPVWHPFFAVNTLRDALRRRLQRRRQDRHHHLHPPEPPGHRRRLRVAVQRGQVRRKARSGTTSSRSTPASRW